MGESLAQPSSLLGQLQRGRGAGFLTALSADRTVVASLLLTCILEDPRFDRQLEHRADYYARLAMQVQLPLAPLEAALQSHTDEEADEYPRLPLPVLARMTRRGDDAAAAILVRYLSYGPEWTQAFEALVGGDHKAYAVQDLGSILLERFPDLSALIKEVDRTAREMTAWDRWAVAEPQVAPIVTALHGPSSRSSEATIRATINPAWDVASLVSHATHDSAIMLGEMVGQRASVQDLPVLLDAFFGHDTAQLRVATRALTMLRLEEALPRLMRFVEEFDAHDAARLAHYHLNTIRHILAATPAALPIARGWLHAAGWARPSVALSILTAQSEEAEVPVLRELLAAAIEHEPGEAALYRSTRISAHRVSVR